MPDFNFVENAEAIYEKSVSATPFPFRKIVKNGMTELLMEQYGKKKKITEAMMLDIIKENTPSAFLGLGIKAVKPLITDEKLSSSL